MSRRVFIGVHHDPRPPAGMIMIGTQAALRGGWVMGPSFLATHAFVVIMDDVKGQSFRLDGQPGGAALPEIEPRRPLYWYASDGTRSMILGDATPFQHAIWGFPNLSDDDHEKMAIEAFRLKGEPYDWIEIEKQAIFSAAEMASHLPGAQRFFRGVQRIFGGFDPLKNASICTKVCLKVMEKAMPHFVLESNLYPESLAQALVGMERWNLPSPAPPEWKRQQTKRVR